jgi:hypothetical protein
MLGDSLVGYLLFPAVFDLLLGRTLKDTDQLMLLSLWQF